MRIVRLIDFEVKCIDKLFCLLNEDKSNIRDKWFFLSLCRYCIKTVDEY